MGDRSSNLVQTALSVTAHFGRALNEASAAGPAGLVVGAIDLRVGSIWDVALLHWLLGGRMGRVVFTTWRRNPTLTRPVPGAPAPLQIAALPTPRTRAP